MSETRRDQEAQGTTAPVDVAPSRPGLRRRTSSAARSTEAGAWVRRVLSLALCASGVACSHRCPCTGLFDRRVRSRSRSGRTRPAHDRRVHHAQHRDRRLPRGARRILGYLVARRARGTAADRRIRPAISDRRHRRGRRLDQRLARAPRAGRLPAGCRPRPSRGALATARSRVDLAGVSSPAMTRLRSTSQNSWCEVLLAFRRWSGARRAVDAQVELPVVTGIAYASST
jgi:hypothetical protein